jgi:branched-subunit amino acid ABC-type transport system permease component
MDFLAKSIIIGLTDQAPLILAAIGMALIYQLSKVINVAYAETITLGAYFGMWFNTTYGLNFYASLILAAVLAGFLSVATYLLVFRPAHLRNVGMVEVIIISLGLSVFLRHGLQFVFGYSARFYDVSSPNYGSVLGVGVTTFQITAVLLVIVLALGLYFFIQKTDYGQQIRALASDESLAMVSGINPLLVTMMIWFIAGMAGGLAGAFWGVGASAKPGLGWDRFLLIFLVVLVGGAWGIRGVIITGLGTGVLLSGLKLEIPPLRAEILLLVAFIVILKLRGDRSSKPAKV